MNNIRLLREEHGMRQEELGKLLCVAASAISMMESGRRTLTEDVIHRLCAIFGVSADFLLGRSALRKPAPELTQEEADLIGAFRQADERTRGIVTLALSAYPPVEQEPPLLRGP